MTEGINSDLREIRSLLNAHTSMIAGTSTTVEYIKKTVDDHVSWEESFRGDYDRFRQSVEKDRTTVRTLIKTVSIAGGLVGASLSWVVTHMRLL